MVSAKYDALAGGREKYLGESELVEDMVRWMLCVGKGRVSWARMNDFCFLYALEGWGM